jgi:hypothetical protein
VELPTNTARSASTKLADVAKEQILGEAKQLGCQRIEIPFKNTTIESIEPAKPEGNGKIQKSKQ